MTPILRSALSVTLFAVMAVLLLPRDSVASDARVQQLIESLAPGTLKHRLEACRWQPQTKSLFSIGHRGAPLGYAEHTEESYRAAATQGAGMLECDVAFTKDGVPVCRHAACDLHRTTDILTRPDLAPTCRRPFSPADPTTKTPASAQCCTADVTVEQFLSLRGRGDSFNKQARQPAETYDPSAHSWGRVMTQAESIRLFQDLDVLLIPELKAPAPVRQGETPVDRATRAARMLNEYVAAGVPPKDLYPQSFHLSDILAWQQSHPAYAGNAVFLEGRYREAGFDPRYPERLNPTMQELKEMGLTWLAPPLWVLMDLDDDGAITASAYAKAAREAGLRLMTWTVERSGSLKGGGGWYFQTVTPAIRDDGAVWTALHSLAFDAGVEAVFSDWPATTTYFANCFNLNGPDAAPTNRH